MKLFKGIDAWVYNNSKKPKHYKEVHNPPKTDEEKRNLCHIVYESGADYIKTSTGFSTGGATEHDISLFRNDSIHKESRN